METDLWHRWRWIDAVTWHCQPTQDAAFQSWYEAHKDLVINEKASQQRAIAKFYYTNDPDVKAFYQTSTGRWLHALYSIYTGLLDRIRHPIRLTRSWLWWLSWKWRGSLVDNGYAENVFESAGDRYLRIRREQRDSYRDGI